jgi:RNA polymerase sigma-70 factor (ECF subfamily)
LVRLPVAPRGGTLDEKAIREFLATDYPRLVAAVALVCGNRAVAEDAVEEALARAWERSERGERIESLKAWVFKVATNLVRSGFRRIMAERRARALLEAAGGRHRAGGPGSTEPSDDLVDLRRALATLPMRQREATVLRYYLDLDVREIAEALGVNEGTAKTTLFRARRALAEALGERDQEEATDHAH